MWKGAVFVDSIICEAGALDKTSALGDQTDLCADEAVLLRFGDWEGRALIELCRMGNGISLWQSITFGCDRWCAFALGTCALLRLVILTVGVI